MQVEQQTFGKRQIKIKTILILVLILDKLWQTKEKLFSDFSPVSTEQWMEKVTADLKGADFEKKLVWKTNEGFKVKPFYRMEDLEGLKTTDALPGEFPYLRGTKKDNNEWLVRQEIRVECPKEANAKALDILNKGVDSLSFHVKAKELNAEYLETLLNDIQAECVELNFSTCQGHVVELANLLVAYFQKKDYDVKKLKGSINYDFFNKMLTRGKEKGDMVQTAKALIEAIQPLPFLPCTECERFDFEQCRSLYLTGIGLCVGLG